MKQIGEIENKLSYIRELLASMQIEPEDFWIMKTEYSSRIDRLEAKLKNSTAIHPELNGLLETDISNLLKLGYNYQNSTTETRRNIIGSLFSEKMQVQENGVRTAVSNEAVRDDKIIFCNPYPIII